MSHIGVNKCLENPNICWKPGQIKTRSLARLCSSVTLGCILDASAVLTEGTAASVQTLVGIGRSSLYIGRDCEQWRRFGEAQWWSCPRALEAQLPILAQQTPLGCSKDRNRRSDTIIRELICGDQRDISVANPEASRRYWGERFRIFKKQRQRNTIPELI